MIIFYHNLSRLGGIVHIGVFTTCPDLAGQVVPYVVKNNYVVKSHCGKKYKK